MKKYNKPTILVNECEMIHFFASSGSDRNSRPPSSPSRTDRNSRPPSSPSRTRPVSGYIKPSGGGYSKPSGGYKKK